VAEATPQATPLGYADEPCLPGCIDAFIADEWEREMQEELCEE